jgi:hypothetical protein
MGICHHSADRLENGLPIGWNDRKVLLTDIAVLEEMT